MPLPTVHPHTERLYGRLPELYRHADETQGYPLLRFLSLIGDQAGAVEDTLDDVDPDRGGKLADPDTAPAAWLPWLAQVLGVTTLPTGETARRNTIRLASNGRYPGSRQAIADAARPALTDPEGGYVVVRPNYQGNPFVLSVNVAPEVAPADLNDVLDAILEAGAKPAGFNLVIDTYAATWQQIETNRDTWAGVEAAGSWSALEATGAA